MAAELGIQHSLLFAYRIVPVLFAPAGDRFQSSLEPFGYRLHVHRELAFAPICVKSYGTFTGDKSSRAYLGVALLVLMLICASRA